MSGRPPVAAAWTGNTKPTVKPSKTSTCTRWSAMPGNAYAAISSGKQILRLIGIVHGRNDQQGLDRCTHQDIRHHIATRVGDERCTGIVSLWTGLGKDIVKLKVSRVIVAGVVIQAFLSRFHSELQRVPPTDIAQIVFRLIAI